MYNVQELLKNTATLCFVILTTDCYQDPCHKFEELCQGARNDTIYELVLNQWNQKEGRGLTILLMN